MYKIFTVFLWLLAALLPGFALFGGLMFSLEHILAQNTAWDTFVACIDAIWVSALFIILAASFTNFWYEVHILYWNYRLRGIDALIWSFFLWSFGVIVAPIYWYFHIWKSPYYRVEEVEDV